MVSTGQPRRSADTNHENRHPLKAKPLESSQVDRSSGPADIDEETLLLIDENLKKPASRQKKEHSFLKRWWSWFFRNRVLVGLVCLLTGGLIAIGVYFGGALHTSFGFDAKSDIFSHLSTKPSAKTCWDMPHPGLCACCVGDPAKHVSKVQRN